MTLETWVESVAPGCEPPVVLSRVGKGQSNLTFLAADAAGSRWVVRRPPYGDVLSSAHDIAREQRVLRALQGSAVPVPEVVAYADDPMVVEAPTLLVQHVEGAVIDDMATAAAMGVEARRTVGLDMIRALAALHRTDAEAVGLGDLGRRTSYARRQLTRWSRQWESSKLEDVPLMDDLVARLGRHLPEREAVAIVHGDFHVRNVIVGPVDGSLRAVLDWELCTLGDPLADLGTLLAYWPQPGDAPTPVFQAPSLPGFPTRDEMVGAYADATGSDVAGVGYWHALGLWKIAVIVAGVLGRAANDPRNRAPDAPEPGAVEMLARAADDVARSIGI